MKNITNLPKKFCEFPPRNLGVQKKERERSKTREKEERVREEKYFNPFS